MSVPQVNEAQSSSSNEFITFWLDNRFFGINILHAKEINNETNFTKIMHSPTEVTGYVNIRGQIYLVLDLRKLLGMDSKDPDHDTRIILFKDSVGENFAILVDKIGDVIEFDESRIEKFQKIHENSVSDFSQRLEKMTLGICRLEKTLMVILNPATFLNEIEKIK